jgi:superfamily II DNA/RNA helicase
MTALNFAALKVRPETVEALEQVGIVTPFPIQEMTLPLALAGNDLIGQAKTGTGKTLGFGIPMVDRVVSSMDEGWATLPASGKPQALAVVPTRELCIQVAEDLTVAGKNRNVRVLAVYGGRAFEPQIDSLKRGVEIVVGTPGRLLDLARQGHLNLGYVRILVLDEADKMLDLGFLPDVERLLSQIPAGRQMMLFSATMPGEVITLARKFMDQPTHIRAQNPDDQGQTVAAVEQHVFRAHAMDKIEMLARILQCENRGPSIVFCRTKRTAQKVSDELVERGFAAGAVHGDLGQGAREQAIRAFRNGKIDTLVATEVAARGLDIEGITHVINFQCPEDENAYLHRIGRTGRAGATGIAITFVDWDELPRWNAISKALELPLADPPETYSSSDHLYSQLRIPKGTTGILPKQSRTHDGLKAERIEDLGETGKKHAKDSGHKSKPKSAEMTRAKKPETKTATKSEPKAVKKSDRSRQRTRKGVSEL